MKAGMYYRNSDVRVVDLPVPEVGDNDILIKVMASGLCGSDLLEWYRIKKAPLVLGHEPSGEIVQVGKGIDKFKNGDRVFATHHVPCGACRSCFTGHETACKTFQTVNNFAPGGFSQYLRVSGRSVISGTFKLPDHLSWDDGAFIEPLGTVVRAMRTISLKPTQSLLVCGSGIAGLLMIKLARALGAGKIFATDMSRCRLEKAKEFGADVAILATDNVAEAIRSNNGGCLADQVIVSVGSRPAAQTGLSCVAEGGTVLMFAVPNPGETIPIDFNPFWRNDMTIKTCYGAAPLDNLQAIELLSNRTVKVTDMITHRFGIDQIQEAFTIGTQPDKCLKVIVEPNR